MAMNSSTLTALIVAKLDAAGFETGNEHARTVEFAQAIAESVVEHIQETAQAVVTSGSSAGSYNIT